MAVSGNKSAEKRILVVGAGVAGSAAALRLSQAGMKVVLAEKDSSIGGHAAKMGCKATDKCLRCNVCVADSVFRGVRESKKIKLMTGVSLERLSKSGAGDSGAYTAVLTSDGGKSKQVEVDAVVVCTGYDGYDATENSLYGYGKVANVITGLDAEEQLGKDCKITRPSDGKVAGRVAFIQCTGSRTEEIFRCPESTEYCSVVCCSYATRMARRLRHDSGDTQVTIFHMDIQNFGKDFDSYYRECRDKVEFVRSRPYEICEGENGGVVVKYATGEGESQQVAVEEFDLVVLSTGIRPAADSAELADNIGMPRDEYGFFGVKGTGGLCGTYNERIYTAGACAGPKDIAGSIAQAEAVCAAVIAEV